MKLLVLNGSPKGDVSVTMQYVKFIRKKFPEHEYQVLNISHEIQRIERDEAVFGAAIDAVRSADAVLFVFPLYTLLVPAQVQALHRAGLRTPGAGRVPGEIYRGPLHLDPVLRPAGPRLHPRGLRRPRDAVPRVLLGSDV